MYDSVTHHLYIVLCIHHRKSNLLPSPLTPSPTPSSTSQSSHLLCHKQGFCNIPSHARFQQHKSKSRRGVLLSMRQPSGGHSRAPLFSASHEHGWFSGSGSLANLGNSDRGVLQKRPVNVSFRFLAAVVELLWGDS